MAQAEKSGADLTELTEIDRKFLVVPRLRGQRLKDQAQLDGWLRDGSAASVESLCEWQSSSRQKITSGSGWTKLAWLWNTRSMLQMRRIISISVSLLMLAAASAEAGLGRHAELLVADPPSRATAPPRSGVRVTYLGTNAYLLEARDATLLIDPYFSRMSLCRVALNLRAESQQSAMDRHLGRRPITAILATHGHFDHLLDVPEIMSRSGAKLIASRTSVLQVQACGVAPMRCLTVTGGSIVRLKGATVRVFAAQHDRIFGRVPFDEPPRKLPPRRAGDWVCGEPLAFLIEMGGQHIYIDSGGRPGAPPAIRGPVDLAIAGVALPDSRARFPQMLAALRPRYVLPSHQDFFFRPLERGFAFGPLSDFPAVLRSFAAQQLRTRMILLDYEKPWTLR